MDLKQLSEQLSVENLVELFARAQLMYEQNLCIDVCNDTKLSSQMQQPYRDAVASPKELASQANEFVQEQLFAHNQLMNAISVAIEKHAGEYTQTI